MKIIDETVEYIKHNKEETVKEYFAIVRENLLLVNTKYIKLISLIFVSSSIYLLFAFQATETLTLTFVEIKKPIIIEFIFPMVYLFLLIRLTVLENKMTDCVMITRVISIYTNKFPNKGNDISELVSFISPYNFITDINQKLLDEKSTKKEFFMYLPLFLLYFLPVAIAIYSIYRMTLYIQEYPALITFNLLMCLWLICSLVFMIYKLVSKVEIKDVEGEKKTS
jgi:hypothetical protein